MKDLKLKLVERASDLMAVRRLRSLHLGNVFPEEDLQKKEFMRDELGKIFLLKFHDEIIATARMVPINYSLTFVESILSLEQLALFENSAWEISRLVIRPEFRGFRVLRSCLLETSKWLAGYSHDSVVIAACKSKMIPLYNRFGFQVLTDRVFVDVVKEPYAVIKSPLEATYKKLNRVA